MSIDDSLYLTEETTYTEIENLCEVDGFSWIEVSEAALYEGVNSMKNIARNRAHQLSFPRGLRMMRKLSQRKNLRLHRLSLDTNEWMIAPRPKPDQATGSLKEVHHELMRQMFLAEESISVGNIEGLHTYYRFLNEVSSKVQAEIQASSVLLKKECEVHRKNARSMVSTPGL